MRNKLVAAAIAGLVAAPTMANAAADVSWFGFNQITAGSTSENASGDGGGIAFGVDRIRIGYKAKFDSGAHSKLQVDFNRGTPGNTRGGLQAPDIIKDAVVGYKFNSAADIQVGERKAPIGMDFNTSGKKLDIVNRGMEKDYVIERTAGAFLFGGVNNFGYAVFVGNPATRSGAVPSSGAGSIGGEDYSYGGRVSYDMGKMLHAELSYGTSTTSNTGAAADDYSVTDIGLKSQPMPNLTLKAEYLSGSSVGLVDGRDQTVWYLHGGYEFTPMLEGVLRYYNSTAETDGTFAGTGGEDSLTMSETYVGLNVFLNPEKHHEARIQVNYIMPSGDTEYPGFHRTGTVTDDSGEATGTWKAMFQTAF